MTYRRPIFLFAIVFVAIVFVALIVAGCSTPSSTETAGDGPVQPAGDAVPQLLPAGGWTEANRRALDKLLAELTASESKTRPVAVFDWDNTVIKNDVGDATMAWMIDHDLIAQPPKKDWSETSQALTEQAQAALSKACDDAGAAGTWMTTHGESGPNACGTEIWSIYAEGETTAGKPAWAEPTTETMQRSYAWAAQLQAGHTPDEVRAFATKAFEERLEAPKDSGRYIRIYKPMRALITGLKGAGVDVWIVSASPQYVVDALARRVRVLADHVVGIRSVVADGKLTYDLQGCGSAADGDNTVMTYDVGKRCWINKAIFGLPADAQMSIPDEPTKRPVFAAGDSDTDVGMLVDATRLRLVIDRHEPRVMCLATANKDGKWLVQPMFIEPKAERDEPYACD